MRNQLFETLLGLTRPWHIARVELNTTEERVDLWAEHGATRWACPVCAASLPCWDHASERTWRHLDTCQCQTHGVRQVHLPWADARARFTALMERLVIDVIPLPTPWLKGSTARS